MKFRKKPVIIEAEQFVIIDNASDPTFLVSNIDAVYQEPWWKFWHKTGWSINTLEGKHEVTEGDWIITGVKGEKYPCKPDIFKMTYERISPKKKGEA